MRGKREADERTRTADPFITSEVLYQLSYVGEAVGTLVHGRVMTGPLSVLCVG